MHVGGLNDDVTMKVMDEDVGKDDFVSLYQIFTTFCIDWNDPIEDVFPLH